MRSLMVMRLRMQKCIRLLLSGLITLEEGTITEGLIWIRVASYHVVAADGKIFRLSAAPA